MNYGIDEDTSDVAVIAVVSQKPPASSAPADPEDSSEKSSTSSGSSSDGENMALPVSSAADSFFPSSATLTPHHLAFALYKAEPNAAIETVRPGLPSTMSVSSLDYRCRFIFVSDESPRLSEAERDVRL